MKQRRYSYGLIAMLVFLVIGLFVIAWQLGTPLDGGRNMASMPPIAQSAGEAAQILQAWLKENWATDGAIVACTLTLSHQASVEANWTFQVYSAQKNHLLVALVQDHGVRILRDIVALYPPAVLSAVAWTQDSRDVLNIWWRAGGATAWNKTPKSTLALRLGMRADNIPVWQFTLEEAGTAEYWEIRADTGVVLEHVAGGQR
ncbi:MAG TPA: hypothetical protein PLJ78_06800 [Anaerolineae bacterium]|nr:hypothetical protein [Anaerolineae bacterium]